MGIDFAFTAAGLVVAAVFIWGGKAFIRARGVTCEQAESVLLDKLNYYGIEPDDGTEGLIQ